MIYFDSAATTLQKPASVPAAVAEAIRTMTTPGRGDHPAARRAADLMLRCRSEAAEFFDVPQPDNVVLTQNATHALNIAIRSLVSPGDTVAVSGYEHNAVTRPLHAIGGVSSRIVNGRLFDREQMIEGFRRAVDGGVKAVICTHMSNVFGYTLPVDEIADICRQRGVPLIVDASQSAGLQPVSLDRWGAAYVAMPGHKGLYGPQGTGLLLCGEGRTAVPLLSGGTGSLSRQQEMPDFLPDRLEAGTQNVHGAAGLLEGIRFVRGMGVENIAKREAEVIRVLAEGLKRKGGFRVFDDPEGNSSVLSVVPLQTPPETLADRLAEKGVAVRAGLH
ncbi:MAG: aminotransferase class V-fold PLP-dependent enzyme, partial [Oscillospiraceae bacterium]|nr:aminotransferase class V-fold PLP-dependent enzyme [Oscillospiraceae bacterium]